MLNQILIALVAVIVAPFIAIIIRGFDRKITARMQGRMGPPVLQPLYDILKLWGKQTNVTNKTQLIWAHGFLGFIVAALVIFVLGGDILMMLFVLALGGVSFVLGALSIKSPYSHIGGNRELIQMMAYEPILFLAALAIFLTSGSFKISSIMGSTGQPMLYYLPLAFLSMVFVLVIKLRKSPFDIAYSHHAHQELVRGPITEYSGKYLAIIELAEYYELVLILGLLSLFWVNPMWVGIVIALAAYVVVLFIDNIFARLTWPVLLRFAWIYGVGLVLVNIIGLYLLKKYIA